MSAKHNGPHSSVCILRSSSDTGGVLSSFALAVALGSMVRCLPFFQPDDVDRSASFLVSTGYTAFMLILTSFSTHLTESRFVPFLLEVCRGCSASIDNIACLIAAPWVWVVITSLMFSRLGQIRVLRVSLRGDHVLPDWVCVMLVMAPVAMCLSVVYIRGPKLISTWLILFAHLIQTSIALSLLCAMHVWIYWHHNHVLPTRTHARVHHYQVGMLLYLFAGICVGHHDEQEPTSTCSLVLLRVLGIVQGIGLGMFTHGIFAYGPDLIWPID
jgi:hypothetical protein